MKFTFRLFFLFLIFTTCNTANSSKTDYDQMAKDLCTCMRPLADMNQQIKNLVSEGKTQEVADLFAEVERIASEGEACATSLEEKYGTLEGKQEKKASTALKKNCPDIAAMLEQSEMEGQ